MSKTIKVNFRDIETKEFPSETTLYEISKSFKNYFNYPILLAKVDNELCDLSDTIDKSCQIEFYDRSDGHGNGVYGRSLQFLLIVAAKKVLGEHTEIMIEYSIDKGFYCEVEGISIDKPIIRKIEEKMHELVKQDLIFTKVSVARIDAIKYFRKRHQVDKEKVLKYISNSYINLYRLDDIYDYFYGELAYSSKDIDEFRLFYIKDNGFVVSFPDIYNPECTLDYKHHKMLFESFVNYNNWGKILGIANAADLNEFVSTGKYGEIVHLAETYFDNQLGKVADEIYNAKGKVKIVLIAGPSSSGKTTTSKRLAIALRSRGLMPHAISIDDYFIDRKDTPKNEKGEYDYESLKAVDVNLFNLHLSKLLDGEKVLIPEYNFILGEREYHDNYLKINNNDIIIIEGLHAMNEELTMSIPRNEKYKIYISPMTQLNIDNHNRIHTSDTRKLRRIVRDNKYRGHSAGETLRRWKDIREGEEKYIFPYQDDANAVINSALIYELGVLKVYAEPLLFAVSESDPTYPEALRLINFLRNFLPIPSDDIPKDSILKEFIGGSCFQ